MGDIKHYALNDQETGRTVVDVQIGHKAMHESDLLAFEIGIRIGQPSSVMCSYNKVNGDWACENDYLLNKVLKGEWKYPGFVVSDWEATHTTVKAALAGLDEQQPGDEHFGQPLMDAVQSGQVPMSRLDDMVHRLLRSMFAAGVIDHPSMPRTVVDPFKGRDDAQHIAEESIVLLRNERGLLPLNAGGLHSIAVIGAHADVGVMSGGGSAQVDAPGGNAIAPGKPTAWGHAVYFPSAPLKYIREHAPGAQVSFDPGTDVASASALAAEERCCDCFRRPVHERGWRCSDAGAARQPGCPDRGGGQGESEDGGGAGYRQPGKHALGERRCGCDGGVVSGDCGRTSDSESSLRDGEPFSETADYLCEDGVRSAARAHLRDDVQHEQRRLA